jgi:hypothetical protein
MQRTIEPVNKYQLQRIPRPGQFLLYIDLSEIASHSVAETLNRLEQMGYEPQLRYLETQNGLRLYALLHDEQLDPTQPIPDHYRMGERLALYEAFPSEDMAIYCPRGLPKQDPQSHSEVPII